MGQSQSRAPAFHPSSVGSHNYARADEEPAEASQHYPTSASGWVKRPRSRFLGRRGSIASTDFISYPHHHFIPKEQRQRSAGPIRSRPDQSEYGPRPAPLLPSALASPQHAPPADDSRATTGAQSSRPDSKILAEVQDAKSIRRKSAHRVSATPRDPPLLEEPESVKDHASTDGHAGAPATPPSDHGHAPVPISPSLALALKAGLGSGSLRRRHGAFELDSSDPSSSQTRSSAEGSSGDLGREVHKGSDLWTRSPRRSIPDGWQSEWTDLRDRPSDEMPSNAPGPADLSETSRFSFGSSDPTTSSGTQSGADSARRTSSLYATPLDPHRFSYTASESGDSIQPGASVSVLRPPRPRVWPNARHSLSSNEGLQVPSSAADSYLASMASAKRREKTAPSHQKSSTSLLSAAAASSDCDPSLSRDHADHRPANVNPPQQDGRSESASASTVIVHRAFDRYEEPSAPVAPSRRSSMLRSIHSDAAASGTSSVGREVEQLRRGPEVKLHEHSIDQVFDPQPTSVARRPRALSLIERLRGIATRTAEASTAAPHMVTVQAQPHSGASGAGSMRSRLRSISLVNASRSGVEASRSQSASRATQPAARVGNAADPSSATEAQTQATGPRGLSLTAPRTGIEAQSSRLSPREAMDLSRPASGRSVHTARSIRSARSYTSSNGSLRARYKAPQTSAVKNAKGRAIAPSSLAGTSWWKQNQLKRKGSEGIVAEAQAPKQGRAAALAPVHATDDAAWVDLEPELQTSTAKDPASPKELVHDAPVEIVKSRSKDAGGLWIWPRRPSAARVFSFGLSRSQSEAASTGHVDPIDTTRRTPIQAERSPVDVIGMVVDTPTGMMGGGYGGPSTSNSSQTSFTSLAPPLPPAPVPPLRRPRRPSQKPNTTPGKERSGSTGSNTEAALADSSTGSGYHLPPQPLSASEASLERSEDTASAVPNSMASTAASHTYNPTSTAPTSVSGLDRQTGIGRPGGFALSPPPAVPRRLSDGSDSGTKEILLSDRESVVAPKISSDSSLRGPVDEQHPDLQSFYPAGTAYTRPVVSPLAITSPLSPMSEEEAGPAAPRRVGGVPDLSSPSVSMVHGAPSAHEVSPHFRDLSLTDASRSFRSVRSFRSTSDGSMKPFRPLPSIPGRTRGYSADHTSDRRDPSHGADSFVTAEMHSRYGSLEQQPPRQLDGLPPRDHLSPLMLMGMGMVAAASPTQWTSSSHDHTAPTVQAAHRGSSSRSSVASASSPSAYTRPLPTIPTGRMQNKFHAMGPRRPLAALANGGTGPPLSPSAFYETRSSLNPLPLRSPAGPRLSWSSTEVAGSPAVASFQGIPLLTSNEGTDVLRRALSQPRDVDPQRLGQEDGIADVDDAELSRLEMSRSGSKLTSPAREAFAGRVDSVEPAPYADTGVQASLAALRALESPGESLRTILARQRMFGEPDASVTELLRETMPQDDTEVLEMSGPRPRRRSAPYARPDSSRYSSDEFSSSSMGRAHAARRRRQMNFTGLAEASSTSMEETSGRSDSEGATLAAIRLARSRSRAGSSSAPQTRDGRRQRRPQSPFSRRKAWEVLAGVARPALRRDVSSNIPDVAFTPPDPGADDEHREQRPHLERYATAVSQPDAASADGQLGPSASGLPSAGRENRLDVSGEGDSHSNVTSPASTMSPALLLKHERVASQVPSSIGLAGSRVAFPSSVATGGSRSIQPASLRSASMLYESSIDTRRGTYGMDERESSPATERMVQRMRHPRQRSRSDVHESRSRNSRIDKASRYDAQLEELLLLREKVLRLERSGKYGRFDSINSASVNHAASVSIGGDHARDSELLTARPRHSSISSKRKSRSSKLGYTTPDIMAWKAGLGSGSTTSSFVA
ncbi:uncharacterized protein PAN0_047d6412 [Moesziomyces antarcticus]|uniref:Uncharacterized protein n=2 Tax=Pseudozyma antarctica TaxID=84753 RepID=A0A081CND0_PSEA2|nr:uncharacterized protein PAN0_047d6412 [Moesziomyces antarcticus]GAK68176.1 conserved hypothetical protein [Moesziomyces antarcticus]SPO45237.1 uncharacterized protein PSANT_02923 [Moesziomyces antarcticus]